MNIGIIGLPQSGKKGLFGLLVGEGVLHGNIDPRQIVRGVADVQDVRFDRLVRLYSPKKLSRARVEVLLVPKIEERAVSQGGIFKDLAEVEAFCHVVRGFESESVYHVSGSVDPVRDIDFVNAEFILHDLLFLEKRIERIGKDLQKVKDDRQQKEKQLLEKLREPLENETPLRVVSLTDDEERIIRSYPLLSRRAMIVVLNVSGDKSGENAFLEELANRYDAAGIKCIQIAVGLEREIASLETPAEREEFMRELGVADTALHSLTEKCIEALGLMSFFTAGPSEVRQWFVRMGANAVEAAGKIHSDLARGFIRAEVIKYNDLVELGSEEKVKNAGKLEVRGRDYLVQDGDILFIRFNV